MLQAGLYSAILSAFIIEAYHLLQSNSPDQSVQVLLQISKQLNSFSINSPFINSTQPFQTPSTMQFEPAPSSVVVNALWFCSLVCSLVTASLGILVKQWLREYISMDCIAAKECCRVRLFRRRGLVKYRVFEIAAFLPLLLQLSLILFFMGLILFILPFHKGICWTVTSLVMIWVIFYVSTTLAPAFSPSCPYKTPFLKTVLHDMRSFLRPLLRRIYEPFDRVPPKEEVFVRSDASMDETILLDADITFKDSDVFETVRRCLAEHQQSLQLDHTFRQLIERRIGRPIESIDHRDLRSLTESEMSGMALTLAQHLKASLRRCYDLQVYQPWNGFIEDAFTLMELMTHRTPGSTFGRLFEAFILIPVAPLERALFAFGDSAVKWMSERRYQPTFPRSMNVSAERKWPLVTSILHHVDSTSRSHGTDHPRSRDHFANQGRRNRVHLGMGSGLRLCLCHVGSRVRGPRRYHAPPDCYNPDDLSREDSAIPSEP